MSPSYDQSPTRAANQEECAAAAPSHVTSAAETKALFERLRELKTACGPNKHDQAIILISACILEGLDTRRRIDGALRQLGLSYSHIAIILNRHTGDDPDAHWWRRDQKGRYSLHDEGQAGSPAAGSSSD